MWTDGLRVSHESGRTLKILTWKNRRVKLFLTRMEKAIARAIWKGKTKNSILDMSTLGYWLSFKWTYWVSSWIFKSEVQGQSHVTVGLIKVGCKGREWGHLGKGSFHGDRCRESFPRKWATVHTKMSKRRVGNNSGKAARSVNKLGSTPPWKLREGNTYSKGEEVMYLATLLASPIKWDRSDNQV